MPVCRDMPKEVCTVYHPKAELLFPHYLIPELRNLRGPGWTQLVDRVLAVDEAHPVNLAFMLMMVELGSCLQCHSESYKFLQGCLVCSARTVRCYKGTDDELVALFEQALSRIEQELPAIAHLFTEMVPDAVSPWPEAISLE